MNNRTLALRTTPLVLGLAATMAIPTLAQDASTDPSSQATFSLRVNARLVPLDIVVTDKKGNPVHGLKQGAFHVLEDDAEQPIKSFDEHGATPKPPVTLPPMGEGVYTNFPTTTVTDSVTVLLLDSLNTAIADQAYVHQQILAFLKTVPPGNRVAIFTLSSRLRMLQSFTSDPTILAAVLKDRKNLPKSSILAGTEFDPAANAAVSITDPTLGPVTALGSFQADFQTFEQQQRVNITQEALQQLGEYLVGIPGRKNLIWFAGNFPLGLSAGPTGADPTTDLTPTEAEHRAMIDLFIRGRISIYPVSAVGLQTDTFTSASQSNRSFSASPVNVTNASLQQAQNRANERIPMEKLAESTGGKAFFDTNGLKQAIDTAVNEGNHFYSLAYVPAEHDFDQKFHKITVSVDGNYRLSYRRGYYDDSPDAMASKLPAQESSNNFTDAMARGTPDSTSIVFKVKLTSMDRPEAAPLLGDAAANLKGKTYRYEVDYAASMRALKLTKTPDGVRHASLVFAAVAYDVDGKALNSLTQEVKLDLKPEAVADFARSGLKYTQVIDLPATPVFLKLGISDPGTGNMGTMEIPLQPKAPLPSAPESKPSAAAAKP